MTKSSIIRVLARISIFLLLATALLFVVAIYGIYKVDQLGWCDFDKIVSAVLV